MNDLKKYIYSKLPNEKVVLNIKRGNKEFELEVTLAVKI